jgi:hypothetical protein
MKTPEQKYILIIDYNLSRYKDVKMMAEYARERFGLETIMIRPVPTLADFSLAKHVFSLDPRSEKFLELATDILTPFANNIVAVLPFSDNAVESGAMLGQILGKIVDSPKLADAAFSKIKYREREQCLKAYLTEQRVFVPKFKKIENIEQLRDFLYLCPKGFVLKPSCEGNNRGVIKIRNESELEEAFQEVKSYIEVGLICEELIDFPEEFSFDGIGHLTFITEKESISARYPVEKGQVVPAIKPHKQLLSIMKAGAAANFIVGQNLGPFHNEIKYDPATNQSAVIEPNRRPAGMKIWHLAEKVYGINFFRAWVDQLVTGIIPAALPSPRGIAGIRQLRAPKEGKFLYGSSDAAAVFERICSHPVMLELAKRESVQFFDFSIQALLNSWVTPIPKDNSGFIAEVCVFSTNVNLPIHLIMDEFEKVWAQVITPLIQDSQTLRAIELAI